MQDDPSINKSKAVANTVMVHSLNEMSIGTANLGDGRSAQGTQELAQRSYMGIAPESELVGQNPIARQSEVAGPTAQIKA